MPFAAALSVLDLTTVTLGILLTDRFGSGFFVLYYPALAVVAVVFTSRKMSFGATTVVALVYVWMSFFLEPRLDVEGKFEKVLFMRIVTMYALVVAVHLMTRIERIRRREAVRAAQAAEQALQTERIRISEEIHDGAAQSAHVISLGLEACRDLAEEGGQKLAQKIEALHLVAKQALWELRYPIHLGPLFEGKDLAEVLKTHVDAFTIITSVPTSLSLTGRVQSLPVTTSRRLFPAAHNALTNAYRHAEASEVRVTLAFENESVKLSVEDDGIGLPTSDLDSFAGHGLRNIRRMSEEVGGNVDVVSEKGKGTAVTLQVPISKPQGALV